MNSGHVEGSGSECEKNRTEKWREIDRDGDKQVKGEQRPGKGERKKGKMEGGKLEKERKKQEEKTDGRIDRWTYK